MYASIIRTLVPVVAGFLITQALRMGIHPDQTTVTTAVQALVSALYYAAFRWAETRLSPAWGWFLGMAKPPRYLATPAGEVRRLLGRLRWPRGGAA